MVEDLWYLTTVVDVIECWLCVWLLFVVEDVWYVTEVSCHSMCYFVHFDVGGCVSLFFGLTL